MFYKDKASVKGSGYDVKIGQKPLVDYSLPAHMNGYFLNDARNF